MKIIQVISSLGNGGAEKFVIELSNELAKKNNVIVCSFKSIENWMIFPSLLVDRTKLVSLNKRNGFDLKTYKELYYLFKIEKPDVVHFHLDATIKYILPFTVLFPKINYTYTIHSNLNLDKIKLFEKLYRIRFLSNRVKYVCISETICTEFKNKFPAFNFQLIENGISEMITSKKLPEVQKEIEKYKINDKTVIFLIIGNYSEPKNFRLIVDVFKRLYETNQNVALLIIGTDTSSDKIEWRKIQELKSPNTHMLGLKSNVQDYMHQTDAFCLCSLYEGLPISILEAYSIGKPVLSTPAGGIPSILKDHFNGLISSDFTNESYYKMILNFLNTSEIEKENIKKNNLFDFKNRFTIDQTANKYILNYSI